VKGTIAPDGLARLAPARVSWQSENRLRFAMKGIAPSAIERMCAQVGLELVALRRIRIGRIPMAALPPGQWRYLPAGERF
jgi:23S rRNA pseudouridine2604 synthase